MRLPCLLLLLSLSAAHAAPPRAIQMVTAAEVKGRMPRGEADRFPPEGKVYAWARVDNAGGPAAKLSFVWRHRGRVVQRKAVTVAPSPSYRTWSRRWLHPQHAGPWTVTLQTQAGEVLATRAFTVGDGPAAPATAPATPTARAPSGCRALAVVLGDDGAYRTLALRPNARRPVEGVAPGLGVIDRAGRAYALRVVRTAQALRAGDGLVDREHDLLWGQPLDGGAAQRWAGFPATVPPQPGEVRAERNHLTVLSVLGGVVGVHLRLAGRAPRPFDRSRYLTVAAPGRPADPTLGQVPDLPLQAVARLSELTRLDPETAPDPARHDFRQAAWALSPTGQLRLYTLMAGPGRVFRVDVPVAAPAALQGPDAQGWWSGPCGAVRAGGSALMVRRSNRTPVTLAVPGGLRALLGVRWLSGRHGWTLDAQRAAWASLAPAPP